MFTEQVVNLVPYLHGFVVALQYSCFQSLLKMTMGSKEGFVHPGDGDTVKESFDILKKIICLFAFLMGRLCTDVFPEQPYEVVINHIW